MYSIWIGLSIFRSLVPSCGHSSYHYQRDVLIRNLNLDLDLNLSKQFTPLYKNTTFGPVLFKLKAWSCPFHFYQVRCLSRLFWMSMVNLTRVWIWLVDGHKLKIYQKFTKKRNGNYVSLLFILILFTFVSIIKIRVEKNIDKL